MKNSYVYTLCIVLSVVVLSQSLPVNDAEEDGQYQLDHIGRVKRATCDLLSFNISILGNGGQLNHAACAAHCLALRKKGGYCSSKAVCICRN